MKRLCIKCNIEKDLKSFKYKNGNQCNACKAKYDKEWVDNNKLKNHDEIKKSFLKKSKQCSKCLETLEISSNFRYEKSRCNYLSSCIYCIKKQKREVRKIRSSNINEVEIKSKKCSDCNNILLINEFYYIPSDGIYTNNCIKCRKIYGINKYNKNILYVNNIKKSFHGKNRECVKCKNIKEICDKNFFFNVSSASYINTCKVCTTKNKREYKRKRLKNDVGFKIRRHVSASITTSLRNHNAKKNGNSCFKFINYGPKELKEHLESQFESWMSWNNWGLYNPKTWNDNDSSTWTWNIDHIIPQSRFKFTSMEDDEFKKCWALNNLRPYSAKQNIIDGCRAV